MPTPKELANMRDVVRKGGDLGTQNKVTINTLLDAVDVAYLADCRPILSTAIDNTGISLTNPQKKLLEDAWFKIRGGGI